jgi:hypothetical protein
MWGGGKFVCTPPEAREPVRSAAAAINDLITSTKANARGRCPHSTSYGLVPSPDAPGGANSEAVVRFVTVDGRGEWCPHYTPAFYCAEAITNRETRQWSFAKIHARGEGGRS